ncbi:arsinothricin resistance N-acetyltransferase ArsN1 family B [Gracilimonas sediminicola]|uniref:GNAT family N-acetyltransferase n=1 Tax=Gracilimonas sediminicola TaxID=2952158 RepID=A0A9X2RF91_9BACT|nr:arsinothricin resistance N-acetyltransferase ArsN1 family B [Gracilimonas sediminicola]MCP9292556.1 GNAT family N-acetyltransferase [Gracilimonas sediminicola]
MMIRPVQPKDIPDIKNIYNYYIRETSVTFEEAEITENDIQSRIQKVESAGLPWLVAEYQNEIAGYAYATKWKERSAYRHSVEISVYVDHNRHGNGWGTKLYQALFTELQKKDIHLAIAGITLPNDASIALHEKFGMEKVAHFKEIGFKFGQWLDVGYWQKRL